MRPQFWLWPLIVAISGAAAGYVMYTNFDGSIRPVISFWYLLFCPGLAFIPLLKLNDFLTEASLSLALSIAINLLVGELMLYLGLWSSKWVLTVIIVISLIGAIVQLRQGLLIQNKSATKP